MRMQLQNRKSLLCMIIFVLFLFLYIPHSAAANTSEAEILIFSLSAEKVKEPKGVLKIQISTFSPILQVTVKGKAQNFPKGASLVWLKIPYSLEPGVNIYRCSFCKINCLEINGLLYKHKVNCEYRLKHEKLFNESK